MATSISSTPTQTIIAAGSNNTALVIDQSNGIQVSGLNGVQLADFYKKANILGTVSQSAGVPTGAVIERGSNANGDYVRFADGTQICYQLTNFVYTTGSDININWVFPSVFYPVAPRTYASLSFAYETNVYVANKLVCWPESTSNSKMRFNASVSQTYDVMLQAIGRWF